jgi:hypothetical protein
MDAAPNSLPLLVLILLADFTLTSFHSYQEWKGAGAPLWRNFGAIVGLDIPDQLGFFGFTLLLTLTLFAVGYVGIMGPFGPRCTALALGALIGARLSDTLISHVLLYWIGYRPNPGLSSTPLYFLEAVFIAWVFKAVLTANPDATKYGVIAGAGFFLAVLPLLWLAQLLIPAWRRRPRWLRGQPIPAWALTHPETP